MKSRIAILGSLGVISGSLSTISLFLPPAGFAWMPGMIFGALISLPLFANTRNRVAASSGAIAVCALSYSLASCILHSNEIAWGFPAKASVAGSLNSLIAGVGLSLICGCLRRSRPLGWTVGGGAAGFASGMLIASFPNDNFAWIAKVTVAMVLYHVALFAMYMPPLDCSKKSRV